MRRKSLALDILDGRNAPDEFMEDLELFLNLQKEEKEEIIAKVIEWFPKADVSEEWEAWLKEKGEDKKENYAKVLRIIYFITTKGLEKRFSSTNFADQLSIIGFEKDVIDFFHRKIDENKIGLLETQRKRHPSRVIPTIDEVNWRIDLRKSDKLMETSDEISIILNITLRGGNTEEITIEFSKAQYKSFLEVLNLVGSEADVFKIGVES